MVDELPELRLPLPARDDCDFGALYDRRFDEVCRWARVLGAPSADLEDLVQEVFIIVQRQLPRFDGRNLQGWLFRITQRTVRDHRRSAWFRRVLHLGDLPSTEESEPTRVDSPHEALERKQRQVMLRRVLGRMSETRRVAFELFELEGYSGEEIAQLLEIPVATVWTRLHHARRSFLDAVQQLAPEVQS